MKKDLRIKGIEAKNFKGIETISVDFKNDHTRIIGLNGSGKTTLKDVVQACFIGVSQNNRGGSLIGEKFRVIGSKGKSSDLKVTLEDVKGGFTVTVTNHMTKDNNGIKITASDNRELTKEWLIGFFNAAFMSAASFVAHTPKDQALLLGINTIEFDKVIGELKLAHTHISRDLKTFGEIPVIEKVERVDVHELYAERDKVKAHNKEQEKRQKEIDTQYEHIAECESKVAALAEQLKEAQDILKGSKGFLKGMPVPVGHLVITHITDQIAAADGVNAQATAYEENAEKHTAKESVAADLLLNKKNQVEEHVKRTKYIRSFKLPLKGLSVDETGGLLLDDRFIRSYSLAEREIIVANLCASQNPHFKTRWIDDFSTLDPANQEKIVKGLIDKGFNVITSEVGEKEKGDGSILLKDCAVVGDNDIAKEEDTRPPAM